MLTLDAHDPIGAEPQRPLRRVEYEALIASDFFEEDERIELLHGRILEMSPPGPGHINVVNLLNRALVFAAPPHALVSVQNPLAVSEWSMPQPDLALVPREPRKDGDPGPPAFLVVEVAESSLRRDRMIKAPLYAAAGIPEYWIVNTQAGIVEVHSEARDGVYTRVTPYRADGEIRLLGLSEVVIRVGEFLG